MLHKEHGARDWSGNIPCTRPRSCETVCRNEWRYLVFRLPGLYGLVVYEVDLDNWRDILGTNAQREQENGAEPLLYLYPSIDRDYSDADSLRSCSMTSST